MKSMSIVDQGSSTFAWVCRCSSGVRRASRPWIHIFAGEKVCIQAMTPTQAGSAFAARAVSRIASRSVRSEERRVGKGGRSRRSPKPEKKRKDRKKEEKGRSRDKRTATDRST